MSLFTIERRSAKSHRVRLSSEIISRNIQRVRSRNVPSLGNQENHARRALPIEYDADVHGKRSFGASGREKSREISVLFAFPRALEPRVLTASSRELIRPETSTRKMKETEKARGETKDNKVLDFICRLSAICRAQKPRSAISAFLALFRSDFPLFHSPLYYQRISSIRDSLINYG